MADRFCSNCGARMLSGAEFCVECGGALRGEKVPAPRRPPVSASRYAPALVVVALLVVVGGAVLIGSQSAKPPPSVPGRGAPQAAGKPSGELPEGHPPIQVPEEVKTALRDLTAKANAAPDDLDAWRRLADVQYRAGQADSSYLGGAEASFKHILERQPDDLEALRGMGNVAFDQQKPTESIEFYERYLAKKPDDPDVRTDLGTMYLAAGKPPEAVKQFETVLLKNPTFFQAQFNLAITYHKLGDQPKTIAALEKSLTMVPNDRARQQVDQLLARLKSGPPPASAQAPGMPGMPAAAAPPAAAAAAPGGTFQVDAEGVFRQNPVLGPKVQSVEWKGPATAKITVEEFPIEQMGEDMKVMFVDRMKGRIKEKKAAHQVTEVATFDIVDLDSGKVLVTITE